MSFVVKDQPPERKFEMVPAHQGPCVCVDVVDRGMHYNDFAKKDLHKCSIAFEFGTTFMDNEGKTRRHIHHKWFTVSMFEQGNLRPFLENWAGRAFDKEVLEKKGFDLETLVGRQGFASVIHKPRKDGKGEKVMLTVTPPHPGQDFQPSGQYVRVKDRETEEGADDFNFGANAQEMPPSWPDDGGPKEQPQPNVTTSTDDEDDGWGGLLD